MFNKTIRTDTDLKFLIDKEISQFNHQNLPAGFDECQRLLDYLKLKNKQIQFCEQDPNSFIYEYFSELKTQVDLRREELKLKIDQHSDKLIGQIEEIEKQCRNIQIKIDDLNVSVLKSAHVLNQLVNKFNSCKLNEQMVQEIMTEALMLKPNFEHKSNEHQNSILNHKIYKFVYNEIYVEQMFGSLKCIDQEVFKIFIF